MITNDFVETYIRIENDIKNNPERVVVDSTGNLIFTTPFITDDVIRADDVIDVPKNKTPANVNLILDNVSFFTTNPSFGNYLPLKLEIGEKQQVPFGDTQQIPIDDYRIVVDPPVNNFRIKNRKYAFRKYSNFGEDTNYILNTIVEANGTFYSWADNNGTDEIWKYNTLTNEWVDLNVTRGVEEIYGGGDIFFYRSTGSDLYDENDLPVYITAGIFGDAVDATVVGGLAYILFEDGTIMVGGDNGQIVKVDSSFSVIGNTSETIAVYNALYYGLVFDVDKFSIFDLVEKIRFNGEIFDDVPVRIYFAGDDILRPDMIVGLSSGRVACWSYDQWALDPVILSAILRVATAKWVVNLPDITDGAFRVANHLYYLTDKGTVFFINLDTGESYDYDIYKTLKPLNPLPIEELQTVLITNNSLLIGGDASDGLQGNRRLITHFTNERTVNQVYRYNVDYEEMTFNYSLSDNRLSIRIALPNRAKMSDVEIFKYAFDIRVRYTKQLQTVNPLIKAPPKHLVGRGRGRRVEEQEAEETILGFDPADLNLHFGGDLSRIYLGSTLNETVRGGHAVPPDPLAVTQTGRERGT